MSIKKNKYILTLIITTLAIAIFGCVMVYSASKYAATVQYNNQFFYLKKQVIGVVIGLIGLSITSLVNNKIYKKLMSDKTKQDKLKNDINNIIYVARKSRQITAKSSVKL